VVELQINHALVVKDGFVRNINIGIEIVRREDNG